MAVVRSNSLPALGVPYRRRLVARCSEEEVSIPIENDACDILLMALHHQDPLRKHVAYIVKTMKEHACTTGELAYQL